MYTIDLTALQPLVNEFALAVLTALASVMAAKACAFLKAKRDGELGQILDKALGMGIAFAIARLNAAGAERGAVAVRSELVASAANYALAHVPQAIKALGLDGAHLARMIEARLHTSGTERPS
ncbi:MAG: hypothetical protein WBG82_09135 [Parvibaculum sp.]|uniref:hypothetical protein n=1 Tax=Parvibaculum sp. TaxID=2024848 RepID=UPI003C736D6E